MRKIIVILSVLLLFTQCQNSPEDVVRSGERVSEAFIKDLSKVHDLKSAQKLKKRFKKHYNAYAQLMILANQQEMRVTEEDLAPSYSKSEELRKELVRVYQIEGVRSLMEMCQQEALHELYLEEVRSRN